METDPGKVHGQLYDLVLNGIELCSGSIRIHQYELQKKVLEIIGMQEKEAQERFGFLLNSFKYGAPPHGGLAPGIDRLIMLLLGEENIREVIAFPKTQKSTCMMTDAPAPIPENLWRELGLKAIKKE
jgi:aspartyl-tRNA synthetase